MHLPADLFRQALQLEAPSPGSSVPLWELEFHAWEIFSGEQVMLGKDFVALSKKEQEAALHRNAEIMSRVSELLDFSALTAPGGYWEIAPGQPAYFWLPEADRLKQIELLVRALDGKIMLVAGSPAVLAMPGAEEYMEFAYTLMEEPEKIEDRASKLCKQGMKEASHLLELGVGAIYTASDIADNHGPYFDPRQMEDLILPFLDKWARHVRSEGGLSILHSDGKLTPCLGQIAETSVHALQAIDPTAGMDLAETKTELKGRLCLCGNIDCGLFFSGRAQAVFESTKEALLKAKDGGGLVLGASNALERVLIKENYLAMLEARDRYGIY